MSVNSTREELSLTIRETAGRLYDESIVIDGLNVSNWDSPAVIDSLGSSGITAINATLVTWENYQQTLDHIAKWLHRLEEHRGVLKHVETVGDILQAKKTGVTGVIFGWQNASPIENDLGRLELFHNLGVRIIQITYHERNLLGNGCFERRDEGLSGFGSDAIEEMNRLGILIDLSHSGDRTTLEAIEASEAPVAFTHANSRSYHNNNRNKTDEALRLLAERGGVVGATCIRTFLRNSFDSTLDDYVAAIDDLVGKIGIDHVAIGTDHTQDQPTAFWKYIGSQQGTKYPSAFDDGTNRFDEVLLYPPDLDVPDKLPNLVVELVGRGYGQDDIKKLLGDNWLRLFSEVWRE